MLEHLGCKYTLGNLKRDHDGRRWYVDDVKLTRDLFEYARKHGQHAGLESEDRQDGEERKQRRGDIERVEDGHVEAFQFVAGQNPNTLDLGSGTAAYQGNTKINRAPVTAAGVASAASRGAAVTVAGPAASTAASPTASSGRSRRR